MSVSPAPTTTSPPSTTTSYQPIKTIPTIEPMRRGRPIKPILNPQPVASSFDPFVKLGTAPSAVQYQFTASSDDDDITSRYPTIEELSGGEFTSSRSESQPPLNTTVKEQVKVLADDAFALPVQPYRKKEVNALADNAFKPDQRRSPAAQIRAALERGSDSTEFIDRIHNSPSVSEEAADKRAAAVEEEEAERTVKPSEVIAKGG